MDIDFATLKIEKKLIEQDHEDVPGVFMVKFLELLGNGNVTMEKMDTHLTITFNTSYQQLRELIFKADDHYPYAYDMQFTVSDTKGSLGVAMILFSLGPSPNIWFSLKSYFPLDSEISIFWKFMIGTRQLISVGTRYDDLGGDRLYRSVFRSDNLGKR